MMSHPAPEQPSSGTIHPASLWSTLPLALREQLLHALVALATEWTYAQRQITTQKGRAHGRAHSAQNH